MSLAVLSLLSGGLLALIFPKFNLWWLAWFALLPLLFAVKRSRNAGEAFRCGYLAGLSFYGATFALIFPLGEWIGGLIFLAWALLTLFLSLYTGIFAYALKKLAGKNYYFLAAPFCWVLIEWLRSLGPFGLVPSLGYSQWQFLPFIQIVSVIGVAGLSFIIVLVNALLAEIFFERKTGLAWVLLLLFLCLFSFGWWQLSSAPAADGPGLSLVLVQGNHSQQEKLDYSQLPRIKADYLGLTMQGLKYKPQIVVWPETAIPFYIQTDRPFQAQLQQLAKDNRINLILGLPRLDERNNAYNSALFISSSGEVLGWEDKHRLVPFGEYLPFRAALAPLLKQFKGLANTILASQDFTQSSSVEPIMTPLGLVGIGICSDSFFPGIFRDFSSRGGEFFLVITNDGWYHGTSAYEKHLMVDAVRAAEFRRYLAHCGNTGISAVIDPAGRIIAHAWPDQREIVSAEIHKIKGRSLYGQFGDWFVYLALLLLAGYAVWKLTIRWRRGT